MDDDELERAVAAALKAGLRSIQEIVAFVEEWLAPIVYIGAPEALSQDGDTCTARLMVATPRGSVH